MKRTPLYSWHKTHAKSLVAFSGWDMPLEYAGIEKEHAHVREHVGMFDVSHMGEIRIEGTHAKKQLDQLFTNTLPKPGRVKYGMMLKADGTVLDDMLVYGLLDEAFMLVVNAGNTDKITAHMADFISPHDMKNVTTEYGLIALQGPKAEEIVQTYWEFSPIKRFQFIYVDYDDDSLLISRTGYTGEDGYEIYVPSYRLRDIWEDLIATDIIQPIGLGARDTLRFEACLPLYGHELTEQTQPPMAGLEFALDMSKSFTGKDALEIPPKSRKLFGIELLDKGIIREGDLIIDVVEPDRELDTPYKDEEDFEKAPQGYEFVGYVTTGYKLKSQGRSLAMAYVFGGELSEHALLIIRGKLKAFKTVDMPFINR